VAARKVVPVAVATAVRPETTTSTAGKRFQRRPRLHCKPGSASSSSSQSIDNIVTFLNVDLLEDSWRSLAVMGFEPFGAVPSVRSETQPGSPRSRAVRDRVGTGSFRQSRSRGKSLVGYPGASTQGSSGARRPSGCGC